jgi:chromosome condensin MukBEF ATPase and DNA-binding subunit MukB
MNTESDLQAAAKVAAQFDKLTRHVAKSFKRQLEIAKAAQDTEAMIKEQIKLEVLKAARMMFSGSYKVVLKVKPEGDWSDV